LNAPWRCIRPGDEEVDPEHRALHVVMPFRGNPSEDLLERATEELTARAGRRASLQARSSVVAEPKESEVPVPEAAPQAHVDSTEEETTPVKHDDTPIDSASGHVAGSVPPADPTEAFREACDAADAAVRDAAARVRTLRSQFRLLERDLKAREKRYAQCEKVIATLQQAAGF